MTIGNKAAAEERFVVQFMFCGDTAHLSLAEFLQLGGSQQQLNDIAAGIKLDAPDLNSEHCDQCRDRIEQRDVLNEYMLEP